MDSIGAPGVTEKEIEKAVCSKLRICSEFLASWCSHSKFRTALACGFCDAHTQTHGYIIYARWIYFFLHWHPYLSGFRIASNCTDSKDMLE